VSWLREKQRQGIDGLDFDVVIVGGGIVGAGVALDLAARGAGVALFERTDYGAETSSRSSKLLHGGIRYLPQMRFGLVKEGLQEQKVLERNADYLFWPMQFILPYYRHRGFGDMPAWASRPRLIPHALRLGLWLYDKLGGRRRRTHRHLLPAEVVLRAPCLQDEDLAGGFSYWDAQTDDSRLTLIVLKTAVDRYGARAVNWAEVRGIERRGAGFEVHVADRLAGGSFSVSARSVVTATGPFPPPGPDDFDVVLAKGIHLVTHAGEVGLTDAAVVLPETSDGRVIYLIPWEGKTWIGTTDTRYQGNPAHPVPTAEDVDYMMRHLHEYLRTDIGAPLTAVAGIRALAQASGATSKASRAPRIEEVEPGLVRVAGGKLTGYRPLAATVADRAAAHLGLSRPSRTAEIALVGAGSDREKILAEGAALGLNPGYTDALYRRYGSEAHTVLRMIESDPTMIADDLLAAAEVSYQAAEESAASVSDCLLRRTHVGWLTEDHGRAAAPLVADVLGRELGWDAAEKHKSLEEYEASLAAEKL
jgi:glycerol-3-phosphate dehydrogenase